VLCAVLALSGCQDPGQPQEDLPPADAIAEDLGAPYPPDDLPPSNASPAHTDFLWEVIGGQGRVYLMGTMHVVTRDYALTPALLDIFDEMDAVALEVNMLDLTGLLDGFHYMYYSEGVTVLDNLSERGRTHLLNMIEAYGLDMAQVIALRPFSLSSSFIGALLDKTDFTFIGVDMLLNMRAWERDMSIYVLEDFRDIYRNMNNLTYETKERIMVLTIPPPEQAIEELENMYEMFLSGDLEWVYEFLFGEVDEPFLGGDGLPIEFTEVDERYEYYMLEHRDRIMANTIISFLESGKNVFAAAGLAHFVGDNSIIYFLEEAGYKVVRVDLEQRMAA